MSVKLTDLQCKEVICISDGRRLGFISDVLVEIPEGKISAIVVPGLSRFLGIAGRHDDYVVAWDRIRKIGPDIVLVDIKAEDCRVQRPRKGLLF